MNRVLCVLLLALIVPVLLIPAYAAEEFLFERVPRDVMLFSSNYEFLQQDGVFVYPGQVPSGSYFVSFPEDTGLSIFDEFCVSYSDMVPVMDGLILPGCVLDCTLAFADKVFPVSVLIVYYDEISSTCLAVVSASNDLTFNFSSVPSVLLSPVPALPSLADIVSSDSLQGVLDDIVSLLPVVFVILVGYIAVRKVLSWVAGLVSGS